MLKKSTKEAPPPPSPSTLCAWPATVADSSTTIQHKQDIILCEPRLAVAAVDLQRIQIIRLRLIILLSIKFGAKANYGAKIRLRLIRLLARLEDVLTDG